MRRAVAALLLAGGLFGGSTGLAAAAPDPDDTGRAPLMIVLDASGSMALDDADGRPRIDTARSAVRQLIGALPDDARLGIETYGTNTGPNASERDLGCRDVSVLQPVAPLDADAAGDTIDAIEPSGYSPIGQALQTAAAALPDTGKRTILLVSDGYDYCATPEPCDTARALAEVAPELTIHVLGIDADSGDTDQLRCIAAATGGRYLDADPADGTITDQLGPALAAGYQRQPVPLRPSGIPIEGTPESSDAAPVMTPGSYLDGSFTRGSYSADGETKRGTVRYYRVPFAAGMTPWASATLIGDVRGEDYHSLGLRLTLVNGADDPCLPAVERSTSPGGSDPLPLLTAQVGGVRPDSDDWAEACNAGTPVYLRAERLGEYRFGAALPVELEFRAEPGVAGDDALEPGSVQDDLDPPEPGGQVAPATGGSDFGSAVRLAPGSTISDTLVAGETRFYAVPLDWGQRLNYRLTPTGVGTPVDAASETVSVQLRNPLRAPVAVGADGSSSFRYQLDGDGVPQGLHGSSATAVRYGNRSADDDKVRGFAVAGSYYLVLSLSPSDEAAQLTVPFTLTVATPTDPQAAEAAPQYLPAEDSGRTRTPPTSVSPMATDDRTAADAAGVAGSATPGWVWGLAGAAAALLIAALVALLRRRTVRSGAPPSAGG
ncbi:VWA domain-containing protein [Nakamurella lactea]|uniref:VWA domain-containing protein n=1 Tax=Nakamurella lactea TaxID=459515 RepID=UPI0003F922A3|nr:VWA domain-containing protein [Nakamurella lactea]